MTIMARQPIPRPIAGDVLLRSARRCALCYGLDGDLRRKKGQIAHIDQDSTHSTEDNLVFLCLEHHDEYDSKTRLVKGLTEVEIREYKQRLLGAIKRGEHRDAPRDEGRARRRCHLPLPLPILQEQLKLVRAIEVFFTPASVRSTHSLFAFGQVVAINGAHMAKSYAQQEFGLTFDSPLLKVHCPAAHFHPDTRVFLIDRPPTTVDSPPKEVPAGPWCDYFHWGVLLPSAYVLSSERLHAFLVSPLLPRSLERPLRRFALLIGESVEAVRSAMNECAHEMPDCYPTTNDLEAFDPIWMWNRFHNHAPELSSAVRSILRALRTYYRSSGADS
jgi:hypothetical protein